jgi:hypothetical protein
MCKIQRLNPGKPLAGALAPWKRRGYVGQFHRDVTGYDRLAIGLPANNPAPAEMTEG